MTNATAGAITIRGYRGEEDVVDFVRIINAEYAADGTEERLTEEGERAWLAERSEQFDPHRDLVFAELDGRPVGLAFVNWVDSRDGTLREYRVWGAVEPGARGRGIGRALLADNERRAREVARALPSERPHVFGGFAGEGRPGGRLLERAGYRPVRIHFEMVRPTLEGVTVVPLPAGLELRDVEQAQHRSIWLANREAFRDHWGGSDESEAARRRWMESPEMDPGLWLIAWDGDEIAGGVINVIHDAENEAFGRRRAWLESVFTRRPWRRRGLAAALIGRSLAMLRERGMTSAGLSVDAENEQGALGLYQAAGFEVADRFISWRKPFEEDR